VLFPAVRWLEPPKNRLAALVERDTTLALEVWAEANGELITTSGKVQPARLHFPAALRAPIQLAETPLPAKLVADKFAATDARQFTLAFAHAIESSPLANRSWQVIPKPDRWRLLRALGGSTSEPERADAALRLLGRCGLAGFDYWPQWPRRPITDSDAVGYRYLPHEDSTNSWIWDLRHYDRSMTSGWGELEASDVEWAGRLCAERKGPGVVLIDEKTANRAEVVAAGLRAGGCAVLLGRTTSGLATLLERHPVPLGSAVAPGATKPRMAIITVPIGPVKLPSGTVLGPEGVVPDRFVPPGASEEVWQAAGNEALEHLRR